MSDVYDMLAIRALASIGESMEILGSNEMVVGFIFSPDMSQVVLIKKKRPDWQAGRLNGIGGKREPGDKGVKDTMTRECLEETGLEITDWTMVADMILMTERRRVVFFFTVTEKYANAMSKTDERVGVYLAANVGNMLRDGTRCIPNLRWLIPLCQTWNDETTPVKPRMVIVDLKGVKQ